MALPSLRSCGGAELRPCGFAPAPLPLRKIARGAATRWHPRWARWVIQRRSQPVVSRQTRANPARLMAGQIYWCRVTDEKAGTARLAPVVGTPRSARFMINRFEGKLDGPVTLDVSWQILQQPDGRVLASKHSVYVIPAGRGDVASYVDRLSQALSEWAADVASAIRGVPPQ